MRPDGDFSSFEGVPLVLASGIEIAGWEDAAPTATFDDGRLTGSTGCNRYTGPYSVEGETLQLGAVASTRMACVPPADAVEREFLAALEQVARWRSDLDGLVLMDDGDAELLGFVMPTPPADQDRDR